MRQPFILQIFACVAFSGIAFAQASPPAIYKAFTPSTTIPVNTSTSLQFTITNPGAVALTGVSFTDTLPAGVVVTSTDSNFLQRHNVCRVWVWSHQSHWSDVTCRRRVFYGIRCYRHDPRSEE